MAIKPATNQEIIFQFKKAAAVLGLDNKNFFRVRAYQAAIDTISALDEELGAIVARGDLGSVPNVGKEIGSKITELVSTGRSEGLEQLNSTVPQGMFPLLDIP